MHNLYLKLAATGMKKNKKLYKPFFLSSILMVAVEYILMFLSMSEPVSRMQGSSGMILILSLGSVVIALFAFIFLFYTSAALIKSRMREFGIYSVLGMTKKNIAKILFWETVLSYAISMGLGLFFGIILSKLSELALFRLVDGQINYSFYLGGKGLTSCFIIFGVIFFLIFVNSVRRVALVSTIDLARSSNFGEKPPKANFFLGIIGALILGGAYYIAATIKQPVSAIVYFFIAVLMVIVGSYLLFMCGSVVLCKILQKNKNYYYKKNHFVSVSNMAYRMKKNGAGLASICILLTCVIVMISSSSCLFFGSEESLKASYPRDICTSVIVREYHDKEDDIVREADFREIIENDIKKAGVTPEDLFVSSEYVLLGTYVKNVVTLREFDEIDVSKNESLAQIHIIDLDEFNTVYAQNETVANDEVIFWAVGTKFKSDSLIVNGIEIPLKKIDSKILPSGGSNAAITMYDGMFLVTPNANDLVKKLLDAQQGDVAPLVSRDYSYQFNSQDDSDVRVELSEQIRSDLRDYLKKTDLDASAYSYEYSDTYWEYYGAFGALFFIGILLSIVFLVAAVLIIYYKQISEGYEDNIRFAVMKKVGMTKEDIKKSISSQILTVFFLPAAAAVIHYCFAFNVIQRLLTLFELYNTKLFILTSAVSIAGCLVFYIITYISTSRLYYEIVNE